MSIPETLLIFVGAPAAIVAVITLAALGPGQLRGPSRYRPGRPWPHEPAWFLPHPPQPAAELHAHGGHDSLTGSAGHHPPELSSAEAAKIVPVGGASGEW